MSGFGGGFARGVSPAVRDLFKMIANSGAAKDKAFQEGAMRGARTYQATQHGHYYGAKTDSERQAHDARHRIMNPDPDYPDPGFATRTGQAFYATSGKAPYSNANWSGGSLNQITGEQVVGNPSAAGSFFEKALAEVQKLRAQEKQAQASASYSNARAGAVGKVGAARPSIRAVETEGGPAFMSFHPDGTTTPIVDRETRAQVRPPARQEAGRKGKLSAADRIAQREGIASGGGVQAGGFTPNAHDEEIRRRYLAGEITREQAVAIRSGGK